MILNLLLAVAPTIIIIFFVLKFDRFEKEPTVLLVKLFVIGAITVIPAAILENLVPFDMSASHSIPQIFLYALLGVALIEETLKYLAVKIYAYNKPSYDEIYDGIIYCVLVSLGFATVENILYVSMYGTSTAIIRSLTAVPAHAIFAVSMGYFMSLGKALRTKQTYYRVMTLAVPILLHAIYDFILFIEFEYAMFLFVPYIIFLYFRAIRLIKKTNDIQPFK